jgi:branched-chain amino acid transport system substrate-binding protein
MARMSAAGVAAARSSWRDPQSIDPDACDVFQDISIRKVEKLDGELYNGEFATVSAVNDPIKAAKT